METNSLGKIILLLGTYQVHPAIPPVSLVLQAEPTVPYQQGNPWILHRLQNLLQKYQKLWVWSEVYEQFGALLFSKRGKISLLISNSKRVQT